MLHICCGPCGMYPASVLRREGFDVHGFFYNPNIHPYQEYLRRRGAVEEFAELEGLRVIWKDSYDLEEWLRMVAFREEARHFLCWRQRLDQTARFARRGRYDYFSSTLLYSRHQDHDLIREAGEEIARRRKVAFYYRDFREGWKDGIERSKKAGLYRQEYCGCIYSERDRYMERKGKRK